LTVSGLDLGANTLAALITRGGLHESTRLGMAYSGQPRTFAGLVGLVDLVLTCTGRLFVIKWRRSDAYVESSIYRDLDARPVGNCLRIRVLGIDWRHELGDHIPSIECAQRMRTHITLLQREPCNNVLREVVKQVIFNFTCIR